VPAYWTRQGALRSDAGSRPATHAAVIAGAVSLEGASHTMESYLLEYLPIVILIAIAVALGAAFILAAWVLAPRSPDPEKVSAYECGFNAFDDARMKFDVRFYLVAILFIIFDLEVAFLFPWAVTLDETGVFGFWSMMVFLGVLTVGFIYEWKKGALEWE
jgi:NADH-quinone oxidoreductase subunit A